MLVQTATGQRPGSTMYHIGDGFYFRVNRQHLKTIYMRCASPGCKVTGSMAADSSRRTHIKTVGLHNHPPDIYKYELMAFSERLYQRCRVETTSLRTIFQEEISCAPVEIRPLLVMTHYLKRMQNLRKRLRAQSLRAKINFATQEDSVLLYEDGTPIRDTAEDEAANTNNFSLKDADYSDPEIKLEDNSDLKNIDTLVVEIQSTNVPIQQMEDNSDESKSVQQNGSASPEGVQVKKRTTSHGFEWTEERIRMLLDSMRRMYSVVSRNKDNPKSIWEEISREIDPDVKWYTVKKKWNQLESGYRTYMQDLLETGGQGLYRPAYMEEVREIIKPAEEVADASSLVDQLCADVAALDKQCSENSTASEDIIRNFDHLYTSTATDSSKPSVRKKAERGYSNNETSEQLLTSLLRLHREQFDESRRRMDALFGALQETRREAHETADCIKRLTDAVIHRLSTAGRIIVAQKRTHS